jgi:ribosomal protein S18 acetylase RimI-like enzyme
MDDDREYREVDDETFDRYVRYAFHPTAEPAGDGSTVEDPSEGEGSATDGAEAGPEVERFDRGLYRPDSDDPVAVAGWHDFRARIRGEYHRLGGVALVATPPEHRRQGHVRELMRRMVGELGAEGVGLSALWPFKRSFYRRLGWETGSRYLRIEAPPAQLRSAGVDRTDEFDPRMPRSGRGWSQATRHTTRDAGSTSIGPRCGGAGGSSRAGVTTPTSTAGRTTTARPARTSPTRSRTAGRTGGSSASARRRERTRPPVDSCGGSSATTARRSKPSNSTRRSTPRSRFESVADPSAVTVAVEVGHTVRLTDVAAGLSALAYPEGATDELVIAAEDPLVDANDRAFALEVEAGRAECAAAGGADASVSLGVGRLSQLAVGYRDASAMASAGSSMCRPRPSSGSTRCSRPNRSGFARRSERRTRGEDPPDGPMRR